MPRELHPENLRPVRTKEEARERGRNGAIKANQTRRQARTIREAVKMMLNSRIPKTSPLYDKMAAQFTALGMEGDMTVLDGVVMGVTNRGFKGDPSALRTLAEVSGDLEQNVNLACPQPPVVIGIHDPKFIAAERSRQNAEMMALEALQSRAAATAQAEYKKPPEAAEAAEMAETTTPTRPSLPSEPTNGPTEAVTAAGKEAVKPMSAREAKAAMAAKLNAEEKPADNTHHQRPTFRGKRSDRTIF